MSDFAHYILRVASRVVPEVTDRTDRPVRRVFRPRATHCKAGHEFSGQNLRVAPDGRQKCRACERRREAIRWGKNES